ncbi:MAG: CRTAC1 family protein [Acidobacteria bacterium]|nr:CRTAC1 family protein [Acidobacteriota bacterium]MBI3425123.1 CRTAC1 family protein [Acidobacteriota bacterium]
MDRTFQKALWYFLFIALFWRPAQTPTQAQDQAQGGANTAGAFKPIKDERNRPITAGGFVDGAPVYFADSTARTGLQKFRHAGGTADKRYILESPSGGIALLDYDNDGWLDVYLVNGSTFAALQGKEPAPRAALFHNNQDGTFSDVTAKAGVANERWGFGVAAGDFDNDGWTDLYVTNFGKNRLYRNNGDGTFTDVAEKLGAAINSWSTGATFGDYDGDGDLDLFVVGYVQFDPAHLPEPSTLGGGQKYCFFRGQPVMCGPRGLKGAPDHLLRNDGGKFTDVSKAAGVADEKGYYGFSAAFCDVNDDGKLDLLVANDSTPNFLYLNKGNGTFADASYESGFALNEDGREQAGMGLAVGDYDNDGRPDVYLTNFSDDTNTLYHNEGNGQFNDVTYASGHGTPTIPFLGWGTGFLDFDNDGWRDVFIANGHVYPQVDKYDWGTTWAQRPLLFKNKSGKTFELLPAASNSGLAVVKAARGAAFGDLDNDGLVDVVINNCDDTPTVLHNETQAAGHWLSLKLLTGKRDAIGATAWLTVNGQRQRADVISGGSYCSQSDLRLHFGLGAATTAEKLEIRWPSGTRETIAVKAVNQVLIVKEAVRQKPKPKVSG